MTYRERREARAERLRGWADSNESKSSAASEASRAATAGIPFGQPILVGHHSEGRHRRDIARIDSAMRTTVETGRKADRQSSSADEIERQLDNAIYSDDPDAIERLREKLAAKEAAREKMKAENAAFRKEHRAELKGMSAYERGQAVPHPSYSLQNLGGVISTTRKRIAQLEREAANGGPPDRLITARYGGSCEACGAELERGQQIRFNRTDGARCVDCNREAQ